jgi:carboxypeptidase Q
MRTRLWLCVVFVCGVALLFALKSRAAADPPAAAAATGADDGAAFTISPETREAVRQLIGESIMNGKAYEYDEHLADRIGPRLTGSANYMRAADWAVETFKSLGLSNVHTEDWTIAATWEPDGPAVGHITSPVDHVLHIYSLGWSPSTPPDGVSGEVVYVRSIALDALDQQKSEIAGKIALFDSQSVPPHGTVGTQLAAIARLRSFKPLAIVRAGGPRGTESMSALQFAGTLAPTLQVQIGLEDSLLIKRLLETGPVTMHFAMKNTIRENVKIPQVIAEIPGREKPDEVVIVGGHLDSWQPGTGAQDNGTGVAGVMEAARAIMALKRPPRRTIRFMLFSGEEQGLLGSSAYVRAHMADLAKIDAVLITDSGSQPAHGWQVMAREDERTSLAAFKPLLEGLGAAGISSDTSDIFSTDHAAFDVLGVPTLVLWNDTDVYDTLHHKASDTFDSVVEKDLTQGVTMVTVTAYAIADGAQPFAAHLSPTEMEAALQRAGDLESYRALKAAGDLP